MTGLLQVKLTEYVVENGITAFLINTIALTKMDLTCARGGRIGVWREILFCKIHPFLPSSVLKPTSQHYGARDKTDNHMPCGDMFKL